MKTIDSFDGQYRFLSNFYKLSVPIEWDGMFYKTVEHAFQAAKTEDRFLRERIRDASTPGEAKKLGRKVPLRPDWEAVKINVMEALLCIKFSHPVLMQWILDTGDADLVEGNTWKDFFWGVCEGKGENQLGKALMRVRASIKANRTKESV